MQTSESKTNRVELLDFLLNYVIPTTQHKKQKASVLDGLDALLQKESTKKASSKEQEENQKTKVQKSKEQNLEEISQSIESVMQQKPTSISAQEEDDEWILYKKHEDGLAQDYHVVMDYHSTSQEETITITYQKTTTKKKQRFSLTRLKQEHEHTEQEVHIHYERDEVAERAVLSYGPPGSSYIQQHIQHQQNFSERVMFLKDLNILPKATMSGVYGFTYLGSTFMARRDDLQGSFAHMVDTHEAIHTPDEYETVRLTDWMLEPPKQQYKPPSILDLKNTHAAKQ